jgi:uncharacterized protein YxeA
MSKKIIIIIAVVVILLGGAIIFLKVNKNSSPQNEEIKFNENQSAAPEQTYTVTASKEDEKNNVYTDSQYKFSFQYPKDFTVTKFKEGEEGDTILIQQKDGKGGFQIFIAPFDEPGPLTKERILQDVPDMKITNAENRVLKNGVPALIFFSEETSLGKTREIWFIKNGYLYQVSTTAALDSLVAQIIGTWKFEQ